LKTAVVDGAGRLGGLCILRGCMPTKALLESAHRMHEIGRAGEFGVRVGRPRADVEAIVRRKDRLIREFADYRRRQLEEGRFDLHRGQARFVGPHELRVERGREAWGVKGRTFVVATGSEVAVPEIPGLEETGFWTSDEAIKVRRLPRRLAVLGGGAIACEFAQYFSHLGSRVTLIQRSGQLLRDLDADVAEVVAQVFVKGGMTVATGTKLLEVRKTGRGKVIRFLHGERERRVECDEVLVALGRRPATGGLGLSEVGVRMGGSGGVEVRVTQQSSVEHIFAAGDACGPYEVVHLAIQQGELAAANAARWLAGSGTLAEMDYRLKMAVIFTEPEVAGIGLGEAEAKAAGMAYATAKYPFNDHGKSLVMGARDGFVKMVAEPVRGEILGVQIVGPRASDLIHEFVPVLHYRGTVDEFKSMPHYHPTLAEILTYPAEELSERFQATRD
ncbi:MAG: NAD(P)/FAD-dependent oxidoreductase, partial [Verrucomicrobiia bacterium]